MLNELDFSEEDFAKNLLSQKIIAIITEYTLFKLDLLSDRVVFRCLKNKFTFEILFVKIAQELRLKPRELKEFLLDSVVTYCAVQSTKPPQLLYPICEFDTLDELWDWFNAWEKLSEREKLAYLKKI
ncbi:MAG: hypothetical protein MUE85_07855 [Microscillaceae bacterium]|jgi:hypothetical protein|nr:hypothetical protein [Microscillaceae bacterium]